jgi:hypothetical protein
MKRTLGILVSLLLAGCATSPQAHYHFPVGSPADDARMAANAQAYLDRTTPEQRRADRQEDALNKIAWSLEQIARSQQ